VAKISNEEVAKWARLFAREDPVTAIAVALAEHGGGPVDTAVVSRTGDVGMWQINQRSHPQWTTEQLKDPQTNAEAMSQISDNGRSWSAWTGTYRLGLHIPYLPAARMANDAVHGSVSDLSIAERAGDVGEAITDPLNVVEGVAQSIGQLAEALSGFFGWLTDPDTWRRIALVVAGGGVVLVGVTVLARGTEIGETVEDVATGVASKGLVKGK
jgi:hypothetical protein